MLLDYSFSKHTQHYQMEHLLKYHSIILCNACVYRKVEELGLSELYLQEEEVRVRCKMLVALAFVLVEDVVAAFESLVEDIPDELIPLIDYFEDTWIGRLGRRDQQRNPLFSIRLWSIYDRVVQGLPRTNNSVEAWHLAFQQTVGLYHPTTYKLVEACGAHCNDDRPRTGCT